MSKKNQIRYTLSTMIEGRQSMLEELYSGQGVVDDDECQEAVKLEEETANLRVISLLIKTMSDEVSNGFVAILCREGQSKLSDEYYAINPNE